MKLASQFVLRIIASIAILYCLAILNVAAAHGPPSYRPHCPAQSNGVDHIICQNLALRTAYNKTVKALDEMRVFYFDANVDHGIPKVSAMFEDARREWANRCGIEWGQLQLVSKSKMETACLIDVLRQTHFYIRCPLVISLVGEPSADLQRAWGDRNKAFCLKEAAFIFDDEN